MARRTYAPLFVGLVCAILAGCGGESDRAPSTADEDTSAPPRDLEEYLLQEDEVPGLKPVDSPRVDPGPPPNLTEDGPELLRRTGYIATTYQPADGERGAGVSLVMLFETAAGARDWMA